MSVVASASTAGTAWPGGVVGLAGDTAAPFAVPLAAGRSGSAASSSSARLQCRAVRRLM